MDEIVVEVIDEVLVDVGTVEDVILVVDSVLKTMPISEIVVELVVEDVEDEDDTTTCGRVVELTVVEIVEAVDEGETTSFDETELEGLSVVEVDIVVDRSFAIVTDAAFSVVEEMFFSEDAEKTYIDRNIS